MLPGVQESCASGSLGPQVIANAVHKQLDMPTARTHKHIELLMIAEKFTGVKQLGAGELDRGLTSQALQRCWHRRRILFRRLTLACPKAVPACIPVGLDICATMRTNPYTPVTSCFTVGYCSTLITFGPFNKPCPTRSTPARYPGCTNRCHAHSNERSAIEGYVISTSRRARWCITKDAIEIESEAELL